MEAERATVRIENTYDYLGWRVRRKSFTGSPQNWTLSEHMVYVHDDWNMIRSSMPWTTTRPSTTTSGAWT